MSNKIGFDTNVIFANDNESLTIPRDVLDKKLREGKCFYGYPIHITLEVIEEKEESEKRLPENRMSKAI